MKQTRQSPMTTIRDYEKMNLLKQRLAVAATALKKLMLLTQKRFEIRNLVKCLVKLIKAFVQTVD